MKTKKFLSIMLSALFVFVSVLSVSAAQIPAEVAIALNIFKVDVTVTAEAEAGVVTARITEKKDGSGSVLGGMYQTDKFTLTDDGKYQYQFHFKMQPTHTTGTYWVHVGNGVENISKDFMFVNAYDKVTFYNSLNAAAKENDGIYKLLTGENSKLTYDLTEYKALSEAVRLLVDEKIEALDLSATIDTVEEVEARFTAEMDGFVLLAKLADANAENWDAAVKAAIEKKLLDGTYYEKVSSAVAMSYFKSERKLSLDGEALNTAFDKGTLLAVEEELDYITLKNAFGYYLDKGIISINESDYKEVFQKKLEDSMFKKLKDAKSKSIEALENDANKIMKDLLDEYDDDNSSSGGGTGSSRPSGSGSGSGGRRPGAGAIVDGNTNTNNSTNNNQPIYNTSFSDLGSVAWAESGVKYLAGKGVLSGRGDGKFYPNDIMTREEFAKLVVLAFDAYDEGAESTFDDVSADSWSYRYIASAARLGLVTGNDRNEFNPSGSITREDMAVIMHRVYSISGLNGQAQALDFADADGISGYAQEAVGVLLNAKIINGMGDGTFAPKSAVTRAQASKVVYELLVLIGGEN